MRFAGFFSRLARDQNLAIASFAVASFDIKMSNLWNDFRKVVKFIDENRTWLIPLWENIVINKKAESETDCH